MKRLTLEEWNGFVLVYGIGKGYGGGYHIHFIDNFDRSRGQWEKVFGARTGWPGE